MRRFRSKWVLHASHDNTHYIHFMCQQTLFMLRLLVNAGEWRLLEGDTDCTQRKAAANASPKCHTSCPCHRVVSLARSGLLMLFTFALCTNPSTNTALLLYLPYRSIMDRFHRDSSLDRATRLKEAKCRRAGYLADLKKRDQDLQRGRHHLYDKLYHHDRGDANERPDALLQDIVEASSAGVSQGHREVYDGLSRRDGAKQGTGGTRAATAGSCSASPRGSHSSPRFHRAPTRTIVPTRPSTTPAAAATGRLKSPARPCGDGSPPKENRQAANDRAVRVYSAGASASDRKARQPACFGSDRVSRSPPRWDDRIPSPSAAEQHRRRLSPRENGRHPLPWPLDDAGVRGAGQVSVFMSCRPLHCALPFELGLRAG